MLSNAFVMSVNLGGDDTGIFTASMNTPPPHDVTEKCPK